MNNVNASQLGDTSVASGLSIDDSMDMSIADVDLADAVKALVHQHTTTLNEKIAHASSLSLISQTAKEQEKLVDNLKSRLNEAEVLQNNLKKEVTRLTKALESSKKSVNEIN